MSTVGETIRARIQHMDGEEAVGDEYVVVVTHKDHSCDFAMHRLDGGRGYTRVASGYIKWDGCMNWMTDPRLMLHHCTPSDIEELSCALQTAYAIAFSMMNSGKPHECAEPPRVQGWHELAEVNIENGADQLTAEGPQ